MNLIYSVRNRLHTGNKRFPGLRTPGSEYTEVNAAGIQGTELQKKEEVQGNAYKGYTQSLLKASSSSYATEAIPW